MDFIEPCFGIGHNLSLICQMTSEDIEFNNLTHSYSLPAVSVFTAELLAISMALQHISVIPVTPFAIVICSDSKAALTAIKSDSQNAREDLVREIATTTHQLITRGTEVRFQWVPAHVCLSGNEKADRAAKRGAKGVDSSTVTMKIGLADVYAELTKQVWKQWEKEFHPMATAKEWDDTSPPCRAGVFFPGIPTYLARIMHRLHVGVWRCMCDERLVSPRDVLLHLMFRPLPTFDWETTQRGTAPVYKKPGSVRPA